MGFREHWVRCDCHQAEHTVLLSFDPDDEDRELYMQPHLSKQSFWRRLKYLFGYQSQYGAFTELVLRNEQVTALEGFLAEFQGCPE